MEQWKPIASAPKDGKEIRVKRDGSEETAVVAWLPELDDWAIGPKGATGYPLLSWQPTHWKSVGKD
jgi:hypothetical protein